MADQLSEKEQVLLGILNDLYVGADKESNIIKVSYSAKSPEIAQQVVSELVNLSLEKHIAAHRTPGSYEFFVEQTEHLKDNLKASEEQLKALKNEVGITSIDQQQTIKCQAMFPGNCRPDNRRNIIHIKILLGASLYLLCDYQ